MTKPVISLDIYQVGVNTTFDNPQTMGFHVGSIRGNIVPTWQGGLPLPKEATGVFNDSLRYKVYSYVEYVTPSDSQVQRFYTNSTVAEIVTNINS